MHHSECVLGWLCRTNTCPLCRSGLPEAEDGADATATAAASAALCTGTDVYYVPAPEGAALDSEWEGAVLARRDAFPVFQQSSNFDLIMTRLLRVREETRPHNEDGGDIRVEDDDLPGLSASDDDDGYYNDDYDYDVDGSSNEFSIDDGPCRPCRIRHG
jgi:hypothetical protein